MAKKNKNKIDKKVSSCKQKRGKIKEARALTREKKQEIRVEIKRNRRRKGEYYKRADV